MKRTFVCYELNHKVAVVSTSITTAGFAIDNDAKVFDDSNWKAIGEAGFEALAKYKEGASIPLPGTYKWLVPKIIEAKTAKQLYTYGKCCSFSVIGQQISIEPFISGGARGDERGYSPRKDAFFSVQLPANAQEMAELIFKGLSLCLTPLA